MLLVRFHQFLTNSSTKINSQVIFWLSLSLTFAAVYSFLGLKEAFSSELIVQDDARQHVFWMLRFIDPQIFPDDLIADYFQSVAPEGYTTVYRLAALLGIHPFVFNKILPPILTLVTTGYCFFLCWRIFPIPAASFIATLLLNQTLGLKEEIISGTARAFAYPLLLAFLYYLSKRSFLTYIIIAILGVFYPQYIFIVSLMLILQLIKWQDGKIKFSQNFQDYRFSLIGLAVAFLVLLPFALTTSEFAPTITVEQARQLPEFYQGGRSAFFRDDWFKFWFSGGRSGMFPSAFWTPVTLVLGILFAGLVCFPKKFSLTEKIKPEIWLLFQLIIASMVMFFTAHLFLFKLHLPGRYTAHSFQIVITIITAITMIILFDSIWQWALAQNPVFVKRKLIIASLMTLMIIIPLLGYPSLVKKFPVTRYEKGLYPELYTFLKQQPKDSLTASLAYQIIDNVPIFAERSVLISREYAIPYHLGYYNQFRERLFDLIEAQYSTDPEKIINFIDQYKVKFWGLEDQAFTPEYLENNRWLMQYQPITQDTANQLKSGKIPLLTQVKDRCAVFKMSGFSLLSSDCLKKYSKERDS